MIDLSYLISAICFIYGLKMLSHPKTARKGNIIASLGMLIAIIATVYLGTGLDIKMIAVAMIIGSIIGAFFAIKVEMTQMPQLVAIFNGFGGSASALVASSEFLKAFKSGALTELGFLGISITLSVLVGTLTFTGSFIAFGKLQGFVSSKPITFPGQQIFNGILVIFMLSAVYLIPTYGMTSLFTIIALSALLGILLVIPIGGADMPVVISLLNSYSGIAAAMTGFVLVAAGGGMNPAGNALIICGSLVGASGMILTQIMCKSMNRSLVNVIFGAVGGEVEASSGDLKQVNIKSYSTEEAAMIFDAAEKIIVVPGYGLAVAQAQHAIREVAEFLEKRGKTVLYAIHPVAGRMPGHMNVLLAEANIPYEQLKDLDEINPEFEDCDVAIVLGANDVVNPAARSDKSSPIYGMPILNVDKARTVIINKRTMNTGFAGVQNELFGYDNSIMVFGDAKDMLIKLLSDLKEL
tara:strand:+ start:306 stop:1703 length:1398 start_codon:yes stop_codon:yes gene_type:complete